MQIGQLVVYESGAVKMQIGAVLYDLEPGISPNIREEVAGITSLGKAPACPLLGEVQQHAVITPDMDHLLRCAASRPAAVQASRTNVTKVIMSKVLLAGGLIRLCEEHFLCWIKVTYQKRLCLTYTIAGLQVRMGRCILGTARARCSVLRTCDCFFGMATNPDSVSCLSSMQWAPYAGSASSGRPLDTLKDSGGSH